MKPNIGTSWEEYAAEQSAVLGREAGDLFRWREVRYGKGQHRKYRNILDRHDRCVAKFYGVTPPPYLYGEWVDE